MEGDDSSNNDELLHIYVPGVWVHTDVTEGSCVPAHATRFHRYMYT